MIVRTSLVAGLLMLLPFGALAQQDPLHEKLSSMVSDEAAEAFRNNALAKIHLLQCGESRCARATEAELEKPPISVVDSRSAMVAGIRSAWATYCGLDHRRSFLPMLHHAKKELNYGRRQLVLLSFIHTDFMKRQLMIYQQQQPCPEKTRELFDGYLPKLPE